MRDRIDAALKEAMKAGDKRRTATFRLVSAAIKDRDIAARTTGRDRIADAEILDVLAKMIKQRDESARLYEEGGRIDLADQEREEITIIREFLPTQMCADDVKSCCEQVIADIGAQGLRDMGKTMNALKERFPGQMDFAKASGIVKELLK
jgi:hypothetical protein